MKKFTDKTIEVRGEYIPISWLMDEPPSLDEVLKMRSSDARACVVRDLYPDGNIGFFRDLIASGMGELIMVPTESDYPYGRLWQIEFEGKLNKYLEVINRTPEPWALDLSEEDRIARGLTKEGYKTVLLGVDPRIKYENIWQAWFWTFGVDAKSPEEAAEQLGFDLTATQFIET